MASTLYNIQFVKKCVEASIYNRLQPVTEILFLGASVHKT